MFKVMALGLLVLIAAPAWGAPKSCPISEKKPLSVVASEKLRTPTSQGIAWQNRLPRASRSPASVAQVGPIRVAEPTSVPLPFKYPSF
jgi:hypothetical protein